MLTTDQARDRATGIVARATAAGFLALLQERR